MDIQAERDLLKDAYGNYYIVSNATGNSLTIVNAALYYAFNQMIDDDFVRKVKEQYPNEIACGKYFADLVQEQVSKLENAETAGSIYAIEEVKEKYELHVKPIYDSSFHM